MRHTYLVVYDAAAPAGVGTKSAGATGAGDGGSCNGKPRNEKPSIISVSVSEWLDLKYEKVEWE